MFTLRENNEEFCENNSHTTASDYESEALAHTTNWESLKSIKSRGLDPKCRASITERSGLQSLVQTSKELDTVRPTGYPSRACATYFQGDKELTFPEGVEIPAILRINEDNLGECAIGAGVFERLVRNSYGTPHEFWDSVEKCTGDECTDKMYNECVWNQFEDPEVWCDSHIHLIQLSFLID